jgi:hypothetical protein
VKRRKRYLNAISRRGLDKVELLVCLALGASEPTPTQVLLEAAKLAAESATGRGALKMAEVLGLVHAVRGERKALLWRKGSLDSGCVRDPKLPDLLPFHRLRDLLQYYRGSLIGTPDLVRDAGLSSRREALGALKTLQVLGHVEIGKLDPQTVAWCWIAGHGQRRVYQRGYFARQETLVALSDGPRDRDGKVRWPWIDQLVYREWVTQDREEGFLAVVATDGLIRYRPQTFDGNVAMRLVLEATVAMPRLQRAVIELTLLRGLSETEAAKALSVSTSTTRRLSKLGLGELRSVLAENGFAPPGAIGAGPSELADAA